MRVDVFDVDRLRHLALALIRKRFPGIRCHRFNAGKRATEGAVAARDRLEQLEVRSFEVEHVSALWHLDFHHASRKVLTRAGAWVKPMLLGVAYNDSVKAEFARDMEALDRQKAVLAEKMDAVKSSSASAWNDVKAGANSAMDSVKQTYEKAKARFD